ncbi:cold shock domain-containing protein [Streptomyces sp. NPDC051704]|uniref:cold shock domain-containing protein n=1 Tax=Streptomyces sp. NPDC051704 TaxID=3365671 RepID=UPI0037B04EAE
MPQRTRPQQSASQNHAGAGPPARERAGSASTARPLQIRRAGRHARSPPAQGALAACSHAGARCITPRSRPVLQSKAGGQYRLPDPAIEEGRRVAQWSRKWFDPDRGTGLISQDGTGPDIHAESRAIGEKGPRLRPGDRVLFDLTHDSAGLRADNIHRPEDARSQDRSGQHSAGQPPQ